MVYEDFLKRINDKELKNLLDTDKNIYAIDYFNKVIEPLYLDMDLNENAFCIIFTSLCKSEVIKHFNFFVAISGIPQYYIVNYDKMISDLERFFK